MAKMDQISEAIGRLEAIAESHNEKLGEIATQMSRQNDLLSKNTDSLNEHMLQTKLTQEQTKILRDDHETFKKVVQDGFKLVGDRLDPIDDHISHVKALTRIAKYLIPLIGLPEAVYYGTQVLDWLKHILH